MNSHSSYTSYADYYGLDAPIAKFDHFHNAGKVKGIYYYPYLPKSENNLWLETYKFDIYEFECF